MIGSGSVESESGDIGSVRIDAAGGDFPETDSSGRGSWGKSSTGSDSASGNSAGSLSGGEEMGGNGDGWNCPASMSACALPFIVAPPSGFLEIDSAFSGGIVRGMRPEESVSFRDEGTGGGGGSVNGASSGGGSVANPGAAESGSIGAAGEIPEGTRSSSGRLDGVEWEGPGCVEYGCAEPGKTGLGTTSPLVSGLLGVRFWFTPRSGVGLGGACIVRGGGCCLAPLGEREAVSEGGTSNADRSGGGGGSRGGKSADGGNGVGGGGTSVRGTGSWKVWLKPRSRRASGRARGSREASPLASAGSVSLCLSSLPVIVQRGSVEKDGEAASSGETVVDSDLEIIGNSCSDSRWGRACDGVSDDLGNRVCRQEFSSRSEVPATVVSPTLLKSLA